MLFALIAAATISTAPVMPSYSFSVHSDSPTWTVEPVGAPEDDAHFELKSLRIVESSRLVQEIKLDGAEALYLKEGWIEAADFDFDGYLDLYVTTMGGSGGSPGFLMRFDPKKRNFLKPFKMRNADPDPKKKVVHTGWRNGYCCSWEEDVRFVPGKFEPITLRKVDRTLSHGPDSPLIETIEERDPKGKMKVVCKRELEDSVEQPVLRVLEGDPKLCLHEGEN